MGTFCIRCGKKAGWVGRRFGATFDSRKQMCVRCIGPLFADIQAGKLPSVRTSYLLPRSEECHFACPVTRKIMSRGREMLQPGHLLVTSRRLLFVVGNKVDEADLGAILKVEVAQNGVALLAPKKSVNGWFGVAIPDLVAEIILAAARKANGSFQPETTGQERDTRYISKEVRSAVWARDGGKCVQCGATSYLEFDHIIPISKGGATSTDNLQLLCRGCNGAKSDHI